MKKPLFIIMFYILSLPRVAKRIMVVLVDLFLCVLTVLLAYYLRLDEFIIITEESYWMQGVFMATVTAIALALPIFNLCGLYRAIFRYSGSPALLTVARAVGIYGLLYSIIFTVIGFFGVPRTVGIIQPILMLLFVGASRTLARVLLGDLYSSSLKKDLRLSVLVYGAGINGRQLVAAIKNSQDMKVIGFLDDDTYLHGCVLNGQPIFNPSDLDELAKKININMILIAMPSISRKRLNMILEHIRSTRIAVRMMPNVTDWFQAKVGISDLRDLDIGDLLWREQIKPELILPGMNVHSKTVMVTGAGGSIGSELCRQILSIGPSKLLMIEQSEFALYSIHQKLEEEFSCSNTMLVPILASVQDKERMREIMSAWHPDTIYHVAAYKHVPLVEHNSAEGIKNNVFGTLRTAQAASEYGVSDFILISTDKAVRPTNIMGASKRLAEMVLQAIDKTTTSTKFSMVRFGNVLDSSGSVVPKFRQQIRDGGPITLTHPEITRYFMTIPEACLLVIQAGSMANGGDVFILNMGEPIKIMDLARRIIELSGFAVKDEQNPEGDIEINITGLRPGEKLYEELLISDNPHPTPHPLIMKANEDFIPWTQLEPKLNELEMALNVSDVGVIRMMMQKLVVNYTPSKEIVDWVYLEGGVR